jgi:hypothetical protein
MKTLSCDDLQSTLDSIAAILDVSLDDINSFLTINHENKFLPLYDQGLEYNFGRFLLRQAKSFFHVSEVIIDRVNWFHLSRSMDPQSFHDGIFPLGQIKDKLFDNLYKLVHDVLSKEEWNDIIREGPGGYNNDLYLMKMYDAFHHGCYAMLVKEIAFEKDSGNHDYLTIPEIIEDIGIGIQASYRIDFFNRFKNNSQSVIVKFYTEGSKEDSEYYLEIALCYAYYRKNNIELGFNANTCFDARNKQIPSENILGVEIILD